jgi:SpoVK/Ycf46/Vps4 family AAA+-type ATPase
MEDYEDEEINLTEEVMPEPQPIKVRSKSKSKSNTTNIKSFHYLENDSIDFSILETKYTTKKLEPKVYNLGVKVLNGDYVPDLSVCLDKEQFNDDLGFYYEDKIKNIYEKFFTKEIRIKVKKLGYNHKLGIILYGKQGTGKTSMFKKYFNEAVKNKNAIVFNITATNNVMVWWSLIVSIRKIQKNPIIIFLDEYDEFFNQSRNSYETEFKRILDGTDSIDNSLFFMTTNYINKIPKTIKERPSRVKYSIEVKGLEDENLITRFLNQSLEKVDMKYDFSSEISKMKGWTIDELKQWVLDKVMDIEPNNETPSRVGFKN